MLEIVAASVLVALGVLIIYMTSESGNKDERVLLSLIIGAVCVIAGAWLFISFVGVMTILRKLLGLALVVFGIFMIVKFPDIDAYQGPMASGLGVGAVGVIIGIIALIFGAYFLFF